MTWLFLAFLWRILQSKSCPIRGRSGGGGPQPAKAAAIRQDDAATMPCLFYYYYFSVAFTESPVFFLFSSSSLFVFTFPHPLLPLLRSIFEPCLSCPWGAGIKFRWLWGFVCSLCCLACLFLFLSIFLSSLSLLSVSSLTKFVRLFRKRGDNTQAPQRRKRQTLFLCRLPTVVNFDFHST